MKRIFLIGLSMIFVIVMSVWALAGGRNTPHRSGASATARPGETASVSCQASFSTGSGATQFSVCVSDHGTLSQFFAAGVSQLFGGNEGYAVCSNGGGTVHGYDVGTAESGFLAPIISQPTAGQFPVTITRDTADGFFQLKQVWAKPDKAEDDVTVTMTLTNGTGGTVNNVLLSRSGDFDAGNMESNNSGGYALNSAFLWTVDFLPDIEEEGVTFGTSASAVVELESTWYTGNTRTKCTGTSTTNPTVSAALITRVVYSLGNIGSGASKTVKFRFARL